MGGRIDRVPLDHARLIVSPGALLTAQRAAELIPVGTESERREWLQERGLVRYLLGRPIVRWGDVLDALGPDPQPKKPAPTPINLPRVKL